MSTSEVLAQSSTIRADHATLLRNDSSDRSRTLAFWASFDANPLSRRRWVDSCAAYWGTTAEPHLVLRGSSTP